MDSPPPARSAYRRVTRLTTEDDVEVIRGQLEGLCISEGFPVAVGHLIDEILADPAKLRRLAAAAGNRQPLRELILQAAQHIADVVDEPGDGYPAGDASEPGVASDDSAAGLSGDETSATDSEDDYYARDDSSDAESWSGYHTDSDEAEPTIEDITMRGRLGEAQDQLSDLAGDGPPDEDLVARPAGAGAGSPPPAKRPRLDLDESPLGAVEVEFAMVEAEISRREADLARTRAAAEVLMAACATYNDLGGAPCAAVDRAERLLETYGAAEERPGNRGAAVRGVLLAEVAAVRAELDRWCEENPGRKRRRGEREALEEIRAEQRSTEEVIDRGAFGRLVREIGTAATKRNGWGGFGIEADAIAALQAAAEDHLVRTLDEANRAAMHDGRTHIAERDVRFAARPPWVTRSW